ncbi:hypothetical protein [Salinisphaera japonica]|nr:hypothetical protein [Salinisphaera japonica]
MTIGLATLWPAEPTPTGKNNPLIIMQFTMRGIISKIFKAHRSAPPGVVISETDIDAVLNHLRRLPYRTATPASWDRQRLLLLIRECIGKKPVIGQFNEIAPGVFAVIKPMGVDLTNYHDSHGRYQVWLMIRSWGTDLARITDL